MNTPETYYFRLIQKRSFRSSGFSSKINFTFFSTLLCILVTTSTCEAIGQLAILSRGVPDSVLVEEFPYQSYVDLVGMDDLKQHREDARYLEENKLPDVEVMNKIFDLYISEAKLNGASVIKLDGIVTIGDSLLSSGVLSLQIQGDQLLISVCREIERRLKEDLVKKEDMHLTLLIGRLRALRFIVNPPPPSDWDKLKRSFSEANYGYIFQRFKSRCFNDYASGNCNSICLSFYGMVIFTLIAVVIGIRSYRRKKMATS